MIEYHALATNEKTHESYNLGFFQTAEEAWWNLEHNLVWDEGDNPEDYSFEVLETDTTDWDYNEDCGFDPYEGCYTYDC